MKKKINMVGLLSTKNEEYLIEEVLSKNEKYFDSIYVIDGSTDNTPEILKKFDKVKKIILEKDLNVGTINDGVRAYVLEEIKRNESIGDTWVTLMHGDEVYYHDPIKVVEDAELEGANGVDWYTMHFFLHTTDKEKWDEISKLPVEERLTWYATNELPMVEFRQFKLQEQSTYNQSIHGFLEPLGVNNKYSKHPIYKHFKSYDPNVSLDTKNRWGRQWESIFVDKHLDNCGNFSHAHKFDGTFGSFEIGLEHLK